MNANTDFAELDMNRETQERSYRLRKAVEAAGGNAVVASRASVGTTTLSTYMNGREWKLSLIEKIALACDTSLRWLLFGDDDSGQSQSQGIISDLVAADRDYYATSEDFLPRDEPDPAIAWIDYFDVAASAGFGKLHSPAPAPQKVAVSKLFLTGTLGLNPAHAIILQVSGDSMEPTLKNGDRLILNTAPMSMLDGLAVLVSYGQLMVKRLATTATGTVKIISDNDRYPVEEVDISRFRWGQPDGADTVTVIGRVAYRLQALS